MTTPTGTGYFDRAGREVTFDELKTAATLELVPVSVELLDGKGARVTTMAAHLSPNVAASIASARLMAPGEV